VHPSSLQGKWYYVEASVTTCCRAFSTGPLKFKPVKNVGFNVLAVLGALLHTAFESWYFTVWLKAD
jgi:hypothetical protein